MKLRLILFFLTFILLSSCTDPPNYSDVPHIEFKGFSKDFMNQDQFNTDSVVLSIYFEDGDGDMGHKDSLNIFITDTRDGFLSGKYRIPFIPPQGVANGISGTITVIMYTTCCYFENGQDPCSASEEFPTDTVVYEIFILDRANNKSNIIQTDPITLYCQ